jgi:hypothetical protein
MWFAYSENSLAPMQQQRLASKNPTQHPLNSVLHNFRSAISRALQTMMEPVDGNNGVDVPALCDYLRRELIFDEMLVQMQQQDGIDYVAWCQTNAAKEGIRMDWDDAKGLSQMFTHYDNMMMPAVTSNGWSGAHAMKLEILYAMLPNPTGNDKSVAASMCRALGIAFNTYLERYNWWMKDFWRRK